MNPLFSILGAFAFLDIGCPTSVPIGAHHVQQRQSWMSWNLFAVMLSDGLITLPEP
jgi:hypothetical protein